jgi:hypothetical protein
MLHHLPIWDEALFAPYQKNHKRISVHNKLFLMRIIILIFIKMFIFRF